MHATIPIAACTPAVNLAYTPQPGTRKMRGTVTHVTPAGDFNKLHIASGDLSWCIYVPADAPLFCVGDVCIVEHPRGSNPLTDPYTAIYKKEETMNTQLIAQTEVTSMSSREIAELTGKQLHNVHRDIRTMMVDLYAPDDMKDREDAFKVCFEDASKGNHQQFQGVTWRKDNRGYITEFHLDYNHTMTLITGYNVKMRKAIIDRWSVLEGQVGKVPVKKEKPSAIQPSKEFRALYGIARLIGFDKNVAAISANQGVQKITGTNLLELMGQTHLEAERQDTRWYTPTELGQILGSTSARQVNMLLAEAGFQVRLGDKWEPTDKGKLHCRILDTGKKHGSGAMITQLKWDRAVLDSIDRKAA